MRALLTAQKSYLYALALVLLVVIAGASAFSYQTSSRLKAQINEVSSQQSEFGQVFDDILYEEHLKTSESIKLAGEKAELERQLEELLTLAENQEYSNILEIQELFSDYNSKISRNKDAKLETQDYENKVNSMGEKVLNKEYDTLIADLNTDLKSLDDDYTKYLASLPPPSPTKAGSGYSYQTVTNERGTFGVYLIKVALSSVRVVTASASGDNCKNNCPTKSLAQHVADNGGYAGINGAYFCPPDYSACGGKVNSSDYALYKSSSGKWLNKDALSWGDTGLATFNGNSAKFYKKSSSYGGGSVTAGISNYPTLLENGNVVVDNDKLSSYQKDSKGLRGAIGVGKENLYLAIVTGATVKDAAYAMRSLGALYALNLDGGGSSAMYINGGYVVGPGRSLPAAVVLVN